MSCRPTYFGVGWQRASPSRFWGLWTRPRDSTWLCFFPMLKTTFKLLEEMWLRPYGMPLRFVCDPDTRFRGMFEKRLQASGCLVEHCPPEAHYVIGMVERRNAILRVTIERLIDQFAVVEIADVPSILIAACHATNQMAYTRGRSAYQAVFGRVPRLSNDLLTDGTTLTSSTQAFDDPSSALRAELVRGEALKCLIDLNAQQQFRRAFMRKTRITKVPDLQPGQRCAVWRWSKRGIRKRGAWLTARFLSWGPSHEGKQAWVRLGASTTLVRSEQLRAAHGFEDWSPDEADIRALKDASRDFQQHLLEDGREAPPEGDEPDQAEADQKDLLPDAFDGQPPPTPSMMVPATPIPSIKPSIELPHGPTLTTVQNQLDIQVSSPTYHQTINQYAQIGPQRPRQHTRSKPYEPALKLSGHHERDDPEGQPRIGSLIPNTGAVADHEAATPTFGDKFHRTDQEETILDLTSKHEPAASSFRRPSAPSAGAVQTADRELPQSEGQYRSLGNAEEARREAGTPELPATSEETQPISGEIEPLPQLPQKRAFDAMINFVAEEDGEISRADPRWGGVPPQCLGAPSRLFFNAYASTSIRAEDVSGVDKEAYDSDTSAESSDEIVPSESGHQLAINWARED